jgi:Ca2+-dependent lipid-binding protein
MILDLQDTAPNTDMSYSEFSPSPTGPDHSMPTMSPIGDVIDGLPVKVLLKDAKAPQGSIRLTIHQARDLEKTGFIGKADPYIVIKHGSKTYKSETVKNNHNPEWNYHIVLDTSEDSIDDVELEVFDEDFGKDDSMGTTTFELNEIVRGGNMKNQWIPLKNCKTGEILISAEYIVRRQSQVNLPLQPKLTSEPMSPSFPEDSEEIKKGTLEFTVHLAKDLQKKGIFGKSDPYALIKLGEQTFKTNTIKNNQNPEWNYDARFIITKDCPKDISLEVFDEDKGTDDTLGFKYINLEELLKTKTVTNKWIPLEKCKTGKVLISANYLPSQTDEKLSPILFQESKSSQFTTQSDRLISTVDASSSPPQFDTQSARASPPKKGELDPSKSIATTPSEVPEQAHGHPEPLGFDLELENETVRNGCDLKDQLELNLNGNNKDMRYKLTQLEGESTEVKRSVDEMTQYFDHDQTVTEHSVIQSQQVQTPKTPDPPGIEAYASQDVVTLSPEFKMATVPNVTSGKIKLVIVKGKELMKKEKPKKIDTYAKVLYRNENFKTKTVKNTTDPEWNYEIEVPFKNTENSEVTISIFEKKTIGKDVFVGTATYDLKTIVDPPKLMNQWIPLTECHAGQVLLSTEFIPDVSSQTSAIVKPASRPTSPEIKQSRPTSPEISSNHIIRPHILTQHH